MPELVSGADYVAWFTQFSTSAWKLETQFDYSTDEPDEYARWLAGEPDDLAWLQPWLTTIKSITGAGKRFERVRVQSEPLTDYLRWQMEITPLNIEAGENIRMLAAATASKLELPTYDFWLIDDEQMAIVHRGPRGTLGGEFVTDPATVAQHQQWRQLAWQHAIPFAEYAQDT